MSETARDWRNSYIYQTILTVVDQEQLEKGVTAANKKQTGTIVTAVHHKTAGAVVFAEGWKQQRNSCNKLT
jgi:hypothetical protein